MTDTQRVESTNELRSPFPVPFGWFVVAWSNELAVGEVKPLEYWGEQLVVWRAEDGTPSVNDAFCPHLGAHFAFGGSVHGNDLACPFHGWRFNSAGENTLIPYSERIKITKPERICSMDLTRLTNDTTSKSKAKSNRSVIAAGGSKEVLANKGGGDGTAIGGSTADGKDLPAFFIFAKDIIRSSDALPAAMPVCRRANPADPAQPMPCRLWCNEKGGVTDRRPRRALHPWVHRALFQRPEP